CIREQVPIPFGLFAGLWSKGFSQYRRPDRVAFVSSRCILYITMPDSLVNLLVGGRGHRLNNVTQPRPSPSGASNSHAVRSCLKGNSMPDMESLSQENSFAIIADSVHGYKMRQKVGGFQVL